MSLSIKSNALFGFSLMALASAVGVQPASAFSELCAGPPVPGVSGPITNGSFCAITTTVGLFPSLVYLGYDASDTDTLTLPPSPTPIFTNNTTPPGSTADLGHAAGVLPFTLNNVDSRIPGTSSYVSGKRYRNSTNLTTDGLGFALVYHFADFAFSSEADYDSVFGSKVPMAAAADAYINSHGGYPSFLFVGVEDLPWAGSDDWNDFIFAVQGLNTTTFVISVAEPATWIMLLLGFAGLGFAAHRSAKRRQLA
jgi:hypothetical protein